MGKYSLESFEKYKVLRMRPDENEAAAHTPDSRRFQTVRMTLFGEIPALTGPSLLIVDVPDACGERMAETESGLCALACALRCSDHLLGVTLSCSLGEMKKRRLWEMAATAFAPKRYYVPVTDGPQLDYMLKHGMARGLYVSGGIYDACEAFAQNNAQQLYKQMPVLVSLPEGGAAYAKYAEGWHAQAVENADANAGWCIALRRLMAPKAITAGGFAPLRFWWTNRGPAYCHEATQVRLRLAGEGTAAEMALSDRQEFIQLADRVHNEIVRVPQIRPGTYRLEFGVFTLEGRPLLLAHDAATADGYYCAGEITVDDVPRPEFEHIWDDYFPDGYYPLEDPKVPGTTA